MGPKKLRITTLKGKEEQLHLACIIPFPKPALLGAEKELSSEKEFPSPGEKEQGKPAASPAFQRTAGRICFIFTPPRDWPH